MWMNSKIRSYLIHNGWIRAHRTNDGKTKIIWKYEISQSRDIGHIIPGTYISGGLTEKIWGYTSFKIFALFLIWWHKIPHAKIQAKCFFLYKGEKLKIVYPCIGKFKNPDPDVNKS